MMHLYISLTSSQIYQKPTLQILTQPCSLLLYNNRKWKQLKHPQPMSEHHHAQSLINIFYYFIIHEEKFSSLLKAILVHADCFNRDQYAK